MKYWERRHLSYFIAFLLAAKEIGKAPAHWSDIVNLSREDRTFTRTELQTAHKSTAKALAEFVKKNGMASSDALKRQSFTQFLNQSCTGLGVAERKDGIQRALRARAYDAAAAVTD